MRTIGTVRVLPTMAFAVVGIMPIGVGLAADATTMNDRQIQGLIETAAKATDRPDHDFAANSIRSLLEHAKDLQLSPNRRTRLNLSRTTMPRRRAPEKRPINSRKWRR